MILLMFCIATMQSVAVIMYRATMIKVANNFDFSRNNIDNITVFQKNQQLLCNVCIDAQINEQMSLWL